jgi:hypothetical protein
MLWNVCCYFFLHSYWSRFSSFRRWHKTVNCVSRNCSSDLVLRIQYMQKRQSVNVFRTRELTAFLCKRRRMYNNIETIYDDNFVFIDRRDCLQEISYSSFRISSGSYLPWHMNKKLHILRELKYNIKRSAVETGTNVSQVVLNFLNFGVTRLKWLRTQ